MDTFSTYEQHFGLSGHPFSTTSDPDFYFESRGHRHAYAYLRHAVLAGECFMVVTGDPGAGKTLLVRKLLGSLEPDGVVAALPNGSALDARGLLLAILSSFRTPVSGDSPDELRAALQACLTGIVSIGRKALVIVDQAEQLLPDAIEELIHLATPQSTEDVPLKVLLVGEPTLRMSLPNIAQKTRRPTFLFCDIGLLSRAETRSYIEHRLRRVRWDQSPSFSDDAHDRIYSATDGVPQRVNQLCHRLLTAASRQQRTSIPAELVDEANAELREENGELAPAGGASAIVEPVGPALPTSDATQQHEAIVTPFKGVDDTRAEDVVKAPAFLWDKGNYGFDFSKIRNAIATYGWLALPVIVVAGFTGSQAEKSVLPSLLADPPRATGGISARNAQNSSQIARIAGSAGLARNAAGQPAGWQPLLFPLAGPLPQDTLLMAQLDDIRARRAREEARRGTRRVVAISTGRGSDRSVPVLGKSESPRVAVDNTKREPRRVARVVPKAPKAADERRTSARQLAASPSRLP